MKVPKIPFVVACPEVVNPPGHQKQNHPPVVCHVSRLHVHPKSPSAPQLALLEPVPTRSQRGSELALGPGERQVQELVERVHEGHSQKSFVSLS